MEKIKDPRHQVLPNFPDFPGKPGSFNDLLDYFKKEFRKLVKSPRKEIYMHVTTAVDKENVKVVSQKRSDCALVDADWKVMAACQDTIVRAMLADMAIL